MVAGLYEGYSEFPPRPCSSFLARFKTQTERSWSPRWRQRKVQSVSVAVWFPPSPPPHSRDLRTASHTKQDGQNGVFHEAGFEIKRLSSAVVPSVPPPPPQLCALHVDPLVGQRANETPAAMNRDKTLPRTVGLIQDRLADQK